jgi:hypothetical protein
VERVPEKPPGEPERLPRGKLVIFGAIAFVSRILDGVTNPLRASAGNTIWPTVMSLFFYFFFVMYTAPYNALISEPGHHPKERLTIGTVISANWALGFLSGNSVYAAKDLFVSSGMSQVGAFQAVRPVFAVFSSSSTTRRRP